MFQQRGITIVERIPSGMIAAPFTPGRYVYRSEGSGLDEPGVHHVRGFVLDAYRSKVGLPGSCTEAGADGSDPLRVG